ncbi:hypothetical protein [Andreprevotia chitinilytica]|uniref:hypothetical protein n=1 Tax=Andreprevotia chitinilytica TaxID=396808 RepID=UPI00068CF049|nr:hypothetical protein [Andreprevotia chitinilytica]
MAVLLIHSGAKMGWKYDEDDITRRKIRHDEMSAGVCWGVPFAKRKSAAEIEAEAWAELPSVAERLAQQMAEVIAERTPTAEDIRAIQSLGPRDIKVPFHTLFPAPRFGPGENGGPFQSGLGRSVDEIVAKSPTLQRQMAELQAQDWRIDFHAGPGSVTDTVNQRILIQRSLQPDSRAVAQVLAHELGHASYPAHIDRTSTESCMQSYLDNEGLATLNNLRARREILRNDGPDIGIAGSQTARYEAEFDEYERSGDMNQAARQIGRIFANGEQTSNSGALYGDYYRAVCP